MGRAKSGRKRKDGKRTPAGRLVRGVAAYDRGSEWVMAMRAEYGENYNSAIGRAYAKGMLGEGNEAKDRFDKARKFASLYGQVIGRDRYRCALNQSPRGGSGTDLHERDGINQDWLLVNIERIDKTGCRPFMDQLLSHLFTDYGPPWLDSLLTKGPNDRRDTIVLEAAIRGIDAIGPVDELAALIHSRLRRQVA